MENIESKSLSKSEVISRPCRVLLVDDNEDAGSTLVEVLCYFGYDARFCNGAVKALQIAETFLPDVCVSDIGMPEMNGYEFAIQLRKDLRHATTKLIALTGYTTDKDKAIATASGFNFHLSKPVVVDDLIASIGAALLFAKLE